MSKGSTSATTEPIERAVLVFINKETDDDLYVEEEMLGLCEAAGVLEGRGLVEELLGVHGE